MGKLIKPLTLEIDEGVWKIFKTKVKRGTRLTDAVALLIHDFVNKGDYEIDLEKAK